MYGKGEYSSEMFGIKYKIGVRSFMQVNPVVCAKLYSAVRECLNIDENNCIAVIKVAEGVNTTYLGAIVGYPLSNNNNSINNCQAIVISGQQLNVYTSKHNTYPPKIVNTAVYTSIEAFYANVNRTNYTFALWHFEEGFYPYLGNEMQIAVEEEAVEVPAGQSVAVKVNNVMAYTVSSNVEGVSYANGQVVVADSVEAGTEAPLTFTCLYTGNTATITIMVTANS